MRNFAALWNLDAQRGNLFPWAPVLFGLGIGAYFSLKFEPGPVHWAVIAALSTCCLAAKSRAGDLAKIWLIATLLVLAGASVAGTRAHLVAENTLGFRYYGPIEGRIIKIDRSASDAVRVTLDRVVLRRISPEKAPARVRVALHGDLGGFTPEPGETVMLTGHLAPPGGAVEPGGYDFQRHAWFQRLGAVGYSRTPVLALEGYQGDEAGLWLLRLRMRIGRFVQSELPGRAGGFAAAITTGDRSAMDRETLNALRASNLAHLLAISGLHMGLLTGFVFAAIRIVIALISPAALILPSKKIAAIGGLVAGAGYLALSGGNVATERAFIMVAVMLGAVLMDRRAITLRAVAVAAMIVLTLRPEALYGPGFQMSFAATTALVAVYGLLRASKTRWPRWLRVAGGVALSSLVAGLATAPIAAAHFNQVPHYGLLANVVSVPLMGTLIIPGAVLAAMLSPVGLSWVGLAVMEPAINWILWVAETVSGWPGALSFVVAPPRIVLPMMALGAIWLVNWQGWGRMLGMPVIVMGFVVWSSAERPSILVSQTGGLIGVMTDNGRSLSKAKGDGFAALSWLENDGDPAEQKDAFGRKTFTSDGRKRWVELGNDVILHATGKRASASAIEVCHQYAVVVVNVPAKAPDGCQVYDIKRLSDTGALALAAGPDGPVVVTARDMAGRRLWSR